MLISTEIRFSHIDSFNIISSHCSLPIVWLQAKQRSLGDIKNHAKDIRKKSRKRKIGQKRRKTIDKIKNEKRKDKKEKNKRQQTENERKKERRKREKSIKRKADK